MHPYAALIGQLVGGLIAMFLFSWLIEWAVTSRIADDPVKGKISSVVAAWAIASLVHYFNEPWQPEIIFIYGLPAILVGIWKYRAGIRARDRAEDDLADTFR